MFKLIYALFKKKLEVLCEYLAKNEKKNLLKNLNYKQDTRFFLYLKKTKFFVYVSIIES